MTGGQSQEHQASSQSQNRYLKAIQNKHGVRTDIELLCKFVRETLFYALIHDSKGSSVTEPSEEVMGQNGKACKIYVAVFLKDKDKISNTDLVDGTKDEREQYLKYLWKEGLQHKGKYNIRKALSNEKSAVYAGIAESFKKLVHDCAVNDVPFPALETLENRRLFPKRYFLFFDTFVRAGRHNRTLWKRAIQDKNGHNDIRFGPAIFEAHVMTTVHENYFKWIFQELSDIDSVEDKEVDRFQMEYEINSFDELPSVLVCTHKKLSKFPFKSWELDYGVSTNTSPEQVSEVPAANKFFYENHENNDSNLESSDDESSSNPASDDSISANTGTPPTVGHDSFFLVSKNGTSGQQFNRARENQRKHIWHMIKQKKDKHKNYLDQLKEMVVKVRQAKVCKNPPDEIKQATAEAKKQLRLLTDTYETETSQDMVVGHPKKRQRRSIDNHTRFSDAKVTFFGKCTEEMKQEEVKGLRQSWEAVYKKVWNDILLASRRPVVTIPVPPVDTMIRDIEDDVKQLLEDCAGMMEAV